MSSPTQNLIATHKSTFDKILSLRDYKVKNISDILSVYMFILYTSDWQKTNQAHATVGFIAEGLSITLNRVRKAKMILRQLELIEDVPAAGSQSKAYVKINHYLRRDTLVNYQEENPELYGNVPITIEQEEKKQKLTKEEKERLEKLFNSFWDLYPKKVEKKVALTKFCTLNPNDEEYEKIMLGLKLYLRTPSWRQEVETKKMKYIPHPHRWIEKRRWEDDIKIEVDSYEKDSQEYLLAKKLFDSLCNNIPQFQEAHKHERSNRILLQSWAKDAHELLERGTSFETIEEVIDFCREDSWFSGKIVCVKDLQKYWDRLVAEKQRQEKDVDLRDLI